MINAFLKAKHWQLFGLIFGIPMVLQFVMVGIIISNLATQSNIDPDLMFNYMKLFPLFIILFMGIFFAWFWAVAIGLQKKVPENLSMKVKKFKVFFFIPLVYLSVFLISFAVFEDFSFSSNIESYAEFFFGCFFLISFLHLFVIFCMYYIMFFVAKTIKTVELQRQVKFGDFAGEFFLILYYPIGIWIIQPKINKMMEE